MRVYHANRFSKSLGDYLNRQRQIGIVREHNCIVKIVLETIQQQITSQIHVGAFLFSLENSCGLGPVLTVEIPER